MRFILTLVGAVYAATLKPEAACDVVPAGGEYYAKIGIGKYLFLEVAEDSKSFRTHLGDFAETSSEDDESEDEESWVKASRFFVSKVEFDMKPDCKGEIAKDSWESYGGLLKSLTNAIGICVHPGGFADMRYDAVADQISLGCLTLVRAVNGVVRIKDYVIEPKLETLVLPRGVFTNSQEDKVYTLRVVDRARIWIKLVEGAETRRIAARYEIQAGMVCFVSPKVSGPGGLGSIFGQKALYPCMEYSPENQTLTFGNQEFKFEGTIPNKPLAWNI